MLCEIHRRKTAQPQVALNHHHQQFAGQGFFPYPTRVSISPPDSDEKWCDSPPPASFGPTTTNGGGSIYNSNNSLATLSEDNERLRRNNNMLMSELAHMRKLYNDIIYFVQNHVKPVTPSNSYSSSLFLCNSSSAPATTPINGSSVLQQKPLNQLIGQNQMPTKKQGNKFFGSNFNINSSSSSPSKTSLQSSSVTILDETAANMEACRTKLFGVPLPSKKRLHPECNNSSMETNKTRLVLEKDDLGLNLMPPSPC